MHKGGSRVKPQIKGVVLRTCRRDARHSTALNRQPTNTCSCVADAKRTLICSQCEVTIRSPLGTANAICESSS